MKIKNFEDFVNENYEVNEGLFGFGKTKLEDFEKQLQENHTIIRSVLNKFLGNDNKSFISLKAAIWTKKNGWSLGRTMYGSGIVEKQDDLQKMLEVGIKNAEEYFEQMHYGLYIYMGLYEVDGLKTGSGIKEKDIIDEEKISKDTVKDMSERVMNRYVKVFKEQVAYKLDEIKDSKKKKDYENKYRAFLDILMACASKGTLLDTKPEKIAKKIGFTD